MVETWKPALHPKVLVFKEGLFETLVALPPNSTAHHLWDPAHHQCASAAVEGPVTQSWDTLLKDWVPFVSEPSSVSSKIEGAEGSLGGMRHSLPSDVVPDENESSIDEQANLEGKSP